MAIDIPGALRTVVGEAGEVRLAYGGFQVVVTLPAEFPWEQAFQFLLAMQHDVWVSMREDRIVITSKPPPV